MYHIFLSIPRLDSRGYGARGPSSIAGGSDENGTVTLEISVMVSQKLGISLSLDSANARLLKIHQKILNHTARTDAQLCLSQFYLFWYILIQ